MFSAISGIQLAHALSEGYYSLYDHSNKSSITSHLSFIRVFFFS